jgi:hypothetical protein
MGQSVFLLVAEPIYIVRKLAWMLGFSWWQAGPKRMAESSAMAGLKNELSSRCDFWRLNLPLLAQK